MWIGQLGQIFGNLSKKHRLDLLAKRRADNAKRFRCRRDDETVEFVVRKAPVEVPARDWAKRSFSRR